MSDNKNKSWEEILQEKLEGLEKKIEDIGQKIDKEGRKFSKDIEQKANSVSKRIKKHKPKHSFIWGVIFICLGLLWLGESLDWFYDLPLFPIIMIIIGILLIVKDTERDKEVTSAEQEKVKQE